MDNIDKLNLCVMEDDEFQRKMLIKMLQTLGVTSIREGSDGRQMLKIVHSEKVKPDIVLCDLNCSSSDLI